jgi:membrane protein CcdC involved in cytochrome C biogenesis
VDPHLLTPLILAAVVILAMYRRVRRSFGPQPVRRGALMFRAGLFVVLASLLLIFVPRTPPLLGSVTGGIAAGLLLGYFGLRHTRFETTDKGQVYIPHTYIGLFVVSLLIIRVAIRYAPMYLSSQPYVVSQQNPWAAYQRNPLTLVVLGLVIGYYVFYNIGILRKTASLALPTTETTPS